jgi:hypothetical protein
MWHRVPGRKLDNVRTVYYRQITGDSASDPLATFVFVATIDPGYPTYCGGELNRNAWILAGPESFPVRLMDNNSDYTRSQAMLCGCRIVGGYRLYYFHPGMTGGSETGQSVMTATIRLTTEIQKALEGAECYQIRFYMGNDPVVLEAAPKQLAALRQFLRTGRP